MLSVAIVLWVAATVGRARRRSRRNPAVAGEEYCMVVGGTVWLVSMWLWWFGVPLALWISVFVLSAIVVWPLRAAFAWDRRVGKPFPSVSERIDWAQRQSTPADRR